MKKEKNLLIKERLGKPKDLKIDALSTEIRLWIAEPKIDGLRGIIIKPAKGKSKAYTSNGCSVPNAKYICEAVDKLKEAWVFDGEFYVKNWNKTQSLVMTQSEHPDAKELCISVFDAMPFKDWMAKESEPLSIRRARVDRLVAKIKSVNVTSMKFFLVRNRKKDILDAYNRALNNGNEGLMLKDPDAAYPFKRDKVWLRHKPKITSDCEVTGIKWGNKGKTGQMLGLIGSLGCKFKWRGKRITFNCSGMDMLMRRKLTKMYKREELVGKIVEVEHEGVTVHGKVRFPQMQRLRLDKDEAN